MSNDPTIPLTAAAALERLLAGNARHVAGDSRHPHQDPRWCSSLAAGQHPVAAVVGCSDSRVPPELVFDQGFGDLFVIRSAGHTLGSSALASLEFALVNLRTPLVVVLAHSSCGAVTAAITGVRDGHHLPNLLARIADGIGDTIGDNIPDAIAADAETRAQLVATAVRTHLCREVAYLRDEDPVVAPLHAAGSVGVVGLYEDLATGQAEVVIGLD